eukprot:3711823-Pyramimonas_sp.AAC.1
MGSTDLPSSPTQDTPPRNMMGERGGGRLANSLDFPIGPKSKFTFGRRLSERRGPSFRQQRDL